MTADLEQVVAIMAGVVPTTHLPASALAAGLLLVDALVLAKAAPSNSAARRLIEQGGVTINNQRILFTDQRVTSEHVQRGRYLVLGVGKRHRYLVLLDNGEDSQR